MGRLLAVTAVACGVPGDNELAVPPPPQRTVTAKTPSTPAGQPIPPEATPPASELTMAARCAVLDAEGATSAACVFLAYEEAQGCAAPAVELLTLRLARYGGPAWQNGQALFAAAAEVAIAGGFNQWQPDITTTQFCGSALWLATREIAEGHWQYKQVVDGAWRLDAQNRAFAFDNFPGNFDGKNSVLNTPGSGVGELLRVGEICSDSLGNCREVTAYVPAGYARDVAARYPVLYMQDGQNVFDDADCCFGHTGWELNRALDVEIAAGRVQPLVVIGVAHTGESRRAEYAFAEAQGGRAGAYLRFFIDEVLPYVEARLRVRAEARYVAGASMGGLISLRLALTEPALFRGAASLSGAFWPGMDEGVGLAQMLPGYGKQPLALYLDHGGSIETGADDYANNIAVRDAFAGLGWQLETSPACQATPSTLCYHHENGAAHDELAWGARQWRMLRYFFAAP